MKDYRKTDRAFKARARAMGVTDELIYPLPLYRFEISKFRWRPSKRLPKSDGYWEGLIRVGGTAKNPTVVTVSLLDSMMKAMWDDEFGTRFMAYLKNKSINGEWGSRYRYVAVPPGDSRQAKRQRIQDFAASVASVDVNPSEIIKGTETTAANAVNRFMNLMTLHTIPMIAGRRADANEGCARSVKHCWPRTRNATRPNQDAKTRSQRPSHPTRLNLFLLLQQLA